MEDPEPLAGLHVEAADVSLLVLHPLGRGAAAHVRGADDDGVSGDDGRCVESDFAGDQIHLLIVFELEVDDPVFPEVRDPLSGLRVQRDQLIAGGDVEDAFLAAVGPVRKAAARELTRRGFTARPLEFLVHPQQLAGRGIERDDGAARAPNGIDHTLRHQRRRLEIELGPRTEVLGLEPPRDLQLAEVAWVDLIERRIPRVREIAAIGRPLAALRADLAGNR